MPGNDEARSLLIDEARDVARYLGDQGMHYSAAVVRDLIDALSKAPLVTTTAVVPADDWDDCPGCGLEECACGRPALATPPAAKEA